jgi:cysteine desulfurase
LASTSNRVYLDHNATSPMRPESLEATRRALDLAGGNPASLHREGRECRALVEQARESVAELTGASPREVVFTSGGSEALAAAIRGVCDRAPQQRRRIVVSALEHSAVLESAELAAKRGFVVVKVPCDREGRVRSERFVVNLGDDVALAALQWANNETGVIQPVHEVGRTCRDRGVPFLVDAVQAAGKLELDPRKAYADLLAVSGHKIGGPQGVGALIIRDGIELTPLIGGGAQEKRRRGGTQSVPALAGFGAAAQAANGRRKQEGATLLRLRAKIERRLRELYPDVRFHGQAASRLPNTVNVALPGVPGETLAIALDLAGFAVSTGSACASGAVEPSHVIREMGYDVAEAKGAVRISMGWSTEPADVDRFLENLPGVVEQVRQGLAQSV